MERIKPWSTTKIPVLLKCILIICSLSLPYSSIAQSRNVKLSQSMEQAVSEYQDHLRSRGSNADNRCRAFRIDYIDIGSEELVLVSPVFFLSYITDPYPTYYSISDSSLVLVYTGIEYHISKYENDTAELIQTFCEYTFDNRILYDENGNNIVPLINTNWKKGLFVITQNKIRSRDFDYHDRVFYHLREK